MKSLVSVLASIAVLLGVFGVAGGVAWVKYIQIEQAKAAGGYGPMPETITARDVEPITFRQSATSVGTVVASKWITLRNEVSGAVVRLSVTSGSMVNQGDVMIELDKSVEQASLESAAARCKINESTFKRMKQAFQSKASTELEVEQSEAELAQSKAEFARLQAIIEKKTMRAPFRARAGLINIHPGQFLAEGTEITTLQGVGDFINIDFMMPQTIADQLKIDQEVTIQHAGGNFQATVKAFDSKADRSTRNLLVRAELRNPAESLTPNDSVHVDVEYGPEIQVMSVPIEAIRRTPMGAHVFVVEEDSKGGKIASMRTVIPGRTIGGRQAIMSGLSQQQQVIADGSFKLREGSPIVVSQSASTEQ